MKVISRVVILTSDSDIVKICLTQARKVLEPAAPSQELTMRMLSTLWKRKADS